jgi:hypothetical protein
MFFSGFKLQPEKITTGKKGTVKLSDRPFFQQVQLTTRKNCDRKNKRYSRLANGGSSDLAGTLRPEKKTYSRLAGYVFQRVQIITGKNYNRKRKKVQSSGRQLETGKKYVRKKRYSRLVVGWRTKHKTQHTS